MRDLSDLFLFNYGKFKLFEANLFDGNKFSGSLTFNSQKGFVISLESESSPLLTGIGYFNRVDGQDINHLGFNRMVFATHIDPTYVHALMWDPRSDTFRGTQCIDRDLRSVNRKSTLDTILPHSVPRLSIYDFIRSMSEVDDLEKLCDQSREIKYELDEYMRGDNFSLRFVM